MPELVIGPALAAASSSLRWISAAAFQPNPRNATCTVALIDSASRFPQCMAPTRRALAGFRKFP